MVRKTQSLRIIASVVCLLLFGIGCSGSEVEENPVPEQAQTMDRAASSSESSESGTNDSCKEFSAEYNFDTLLVIYRCNGQVRNQEVFAEDAIDQLEANLEEDLKEDGYDKFYCNYTEGKTVYTCYASRGE